MSRNRALSMLQKTYDDSYLSCSTAVYHEGQGNETEAMKHWQSALDHIYDHNANRAPPLFTPRSDTEKALTDALKQLELQCKERIDLLEALRVSRQNSPSVASTPSGRPSKALEPDYLDPNGNSRGSIGQGTIPAVTYSELSRPSIPHRPSPFEKKPSLPPRPSSDALPGTSNNSQRASNSNSKLSVVTEPVPGDKSPHETSPLRYPSPDRYTMRTTLRSGKSSDKSSTKGSNKPAKAPGEGPSKAATLAWNSLAPRDRIQITSATASPSTSASMTDKPPKTLHSGERYLLDQPRKPLPTNGREDRPRRYVSSSRETSSYVLGAESHRQPQTSAEHTRSTVSNISVSAASSALYPSTGQDCPPAPAHRPSRQAERAHPQDPTTSLRTPRRSEARLETGEGEHRYTSRERRHLSESPARQTTPSRRSGRDKDPVKNMQGQADPHQREVLSISQTTLLSSSEEDNYKLAKPKLRTKPANNRVAEPVTQCWNHSSSTESLEGGDEVLDEAPAWKRKKENLLKNLPTGIDEGAAKQILNDVVVQGDEVHWSDVAGLDIAKNALREAVVYPFLRPDLFMGLREPARGMLLFGPPGTGKTMLARAVATESRSTFFSISASSLTSKFLGESEKLVRALFGLAKVLAPSIIFVDEIDSLLSQRSGSGEHEATRRIKTEFLIQWSDLQRAAAGREMTGRDKERGDANRVLVLAATNLPWAIDEAARRRFVRRQYIPLPEDTTRETQLRTLLGQQKHGLTDEDIKRLVDLTDGFSGSDITALAKDAAMGPLRSLGEALLHMTMDDIRPIMLVDFEMSLGSIRPSVGKTGLKQYEDWAKEFGERGG